MQTFSENNKRIYEKSNQTLHDLMQYALDKAKKLGADQAAVAVSRDDGLSVDVRMREVETVAFQEDKEFAVTVYCNNRKGNASSTDTSLEAVDAVVTKAYQIAQVSEADPCFGLPDKELIQNIYPELDLYHPWDIKPEKAIDIAIACETAALSADKRIVNSDGVNLSTYNFYQGYANSLGFAGVTHSTRHSISCVLVAKSGDSMQRDYDYTTARNPNALNDIETLASNAVMHTVSRLGAKQIKTQRAPVIFVPRIASGLFSNFVAAISGSNLYRKHSFLIDAVGQTIFPASIQIYEQPHLLGALGSAPFDSEGIVTRNNVLVADGVLQQYVLGSYTARKLGLKTTANAGGVFNLTIDPTITGGLQELIKTMQQGLVVTELMGDGVNLVTGDYSRGATGFWVENGAIQYPVEEVTIAGNLRDMYQKIAAVGSDIDINRATRCGSILIEDMMIGGS